MSNVHSDSAPRIQDRGFLALKGRGDRAMCIRIADIVFIEHNGDYRGLTMIQTRSHGLVFVEEPSGLVIAKLREASSSLMALPFVHGDVDDAAAVAAGGGGEIQPDGTERRPL